MELILWRHADAEPGVDDLERKLTAKGRRQAARMAQWLHEHLPARFTVVSSPAKRALQTAEALEVSVKTLDLLAPDGSADEILKAVNWPNRAGEVVIAVGHQPTLGRTVSRILGHEADLSIQKGAIWWIEARTKGGVPAVRVRAVLAPDFV